MEEDNPKTPTNPTSSSSSSSSKKRKRLTPDERMHSERERAEKRQKLEEERARKDEEKRQKELERQEKAKAKEQERIEKERQKELERVKKEEERKRKEEAKEQERVKKEEEIAKKNEEKRKKEEDRLKKEEEKRKLQDEKDREKQKEEEKKAKQANLFSMFFQKSPATTKVKTLNIEPTVMRNRTSESSSTGDPESDKENSSDLPYPKDRMRTEIITPMDETSDVQIVLVKKLEVAKFSPFPFQIKSNMAIAPLLRRNPLNEFQRNYLEKLMVGSADEDYIDKGATSAFGDLDLDNPTKNKYLSDLVERAKRKELGTSGRTVIVNNEDGETDKDVKIVMEDVIRPSEGYVKFRMKLLQFKENRRPAYWGTWKRKATNVKPVRPLAREEDIDYEFDSDEEWEEDELEDGEEIENSEGEEEMEADPAEGVPLDEDDEEGWMVPHGYLSDEEREGEQMDLDVIKSKEKEFFKSLKEHVKMGIPVIQTEKLSDFKMLFPSGRYMLC